MKMWLFLAVAFAGTAFGVTPEERLAYYCSTYDSCRTQFLRASDKLIHRLTKEEAQKVQRGNWKVPSNVDQNLYTDWLYLPATKAPKRLILITSGTHGVEGFMGSAVQKYLLDEVLATYDRSTTGVIVVHAINPYGFKYLRRVSENNVDLNRNFDTDRDLFKFHNAGYAKLEELLNPKTTVRYTYWSGTKFLASVLRLLATEKMATLRTATLQGQYEYPRGIYYGGKDFEPQKGLVESFMDEKAGSYPVVMHLDLHTGYGTKAFMHLFPNVIKDEGTVKLMKQVFRGYPMEDAAGEDFYETKGDFTLYTTKRMLELKKRVVPMVLEYGTNDNQGTRGGIESLRMSIVENQLHHHGARAPHVAKQIKQDFLELYFPKSKKWRMTTMETTVKWVPVFLNRFREIE